MELETQLEDQLQWTKCAPSERSDVGPFHTTVLGACIWGYIRIAHDILPDGQFHSDRTIDSKDDAINFLL